MTDDEQPKNVTIRPGIVFMEHPSIEAGLIRWGKKSYKVDTEGHPVEVTDCDCDGRDSGDCNCNQSRCCP